MKNRWIKNNRCLCQKPIHAIKKGYDEHYAIRRILDNANKVGNLDASLGAWYIHVGYCMYSRSIRLLVFQHGLKGTDLRNG